ncbi:retrovirus-related pol polyprotein from transposon TNT 1-94 [Tanacetum coccineum]
MSHFRVFTADGVRQLLSAEYKGRGRKQDRGQKQNRGRSKSKKRALKDKEVRMAVRDYDEALLERFKLRFGKVHLAHDKTLDIAAVGDVVLKTSFGTSWPLKDVRYIPGLKKRLISVGSLMRKVPHRLRRPAVEDVYGPTSVASIGGSRYYVTFIDDNNMKVKCLKSDNGREYSSREFIDYCAENRIRMLKTVSKTPQRNGKEVSLAYLKVFGCDSYVKVKDVARDKLDSKGHKVIRSRDFTFNEEFLYGAKAASDSSNLTKKNQKDQVVLEDSLENLIRVRSPKAVGAPRIVEDHMKKTLKMEHSSRREAPILHMYKDPPESPGLQLPTKKKALQSKWVFRVKEDQDGSKSCEDDYNQRARYKRCAMDHCCYLKKVGSSSTILLLYVDDMLVPSSDMAEIKKLKRQLSQEFEMKDLGFAKEILSMSIIRDKTKEARCQPLGDHFKLNKKQAPKTEASRRRITKVPYASAVGGVMCTRPDIAHAVGVVSRFMSNLGREHREAVKWLLRYLKGTSKDTLCFSIKEVVLEGFFDSYSGGCLDSGKSTTVYVFTMGGTTVSWMSRI